MCERMQITTKDIYNLLGVAHPAAPVARITNFVIDSREVRQGSCFIAVVGERFDGHDFLLQAMAAGAVMAIVMRQADGMCCQVADTTAVLLTIANFIREKFINLPMAGITGSCGKTSTREILTAILQQQFKVLFSIKSFNNHIGVPLTIFKLIEDSYDCMVQEIGTNHPGEIATLTAVAKPQCVIITAIMPVHIEFLGSVAGVAQEKSDILDETNLHAAGYAILPADSQFYPMLQARVAKRKVYSFGFSAAADFNAADIKLLHDGTEFTLRIMGAAYKVKSKLLGKHNVSNTLAAVAAAYAMGVSIENIITGIAVASGVERRLKILKGINGCTIIDDSYNANPEAMKASLEVLAARNGKKIFVAGGMAELGSMAEELHAEVGAFAKSIGVDHLLCFGGCSASYVKSFGENARHFVSKDELIAELNSLAAANTSILVKGSFSMGMDVIVNSLLEKELT